MIKKIIKKVSDKVNSVAQVSFNSENFIESTPEMSALCRRAGAEGIIMLKNEGNALPLSSSDTISIFGRVQINYFFVGYGSGGDVNAPYKINLLDACRANGINVNESLAEIYENWCAENVPYDGFWGHWPMCYDEMPVSDELVADAAKKSNAAIIVIGRSAGEDRESTLSEGSYYLNAEERDLLNKVTNLFNRVIILLNCGSIMDMSWVETYGSKISSILYVWQGGMESGNSICDILSGKISPCGKLTDTIAKSYELYPTAKNFSDKKFNNYQEDIFVDYRYFETFNPGGVLYPFGFGLSYADFDIRFNRFIHRDDSFTVSIDVTNTSETFSGKEVLQIYVEPPQGVLGKEKRRLVAFAKTKSLAPSETERIRLRFDEYSLASFDDSGTTGYKNSYVLEAGEYKFFIGHNVRSADFVRSILVPKTKLIQQLSEACAPVEKFERLIAKTDGKRLLAKTFPAPLRELELKSRILNNLPLEISQTGDVGIKLQNVKSGKASMNDFVAQLNFDELEAISRGDYTMDSPLGPSGNAGVFGGVLESLRAKGVPPIVTTDGPSGIRLRCGCSLLPNGVALASTFDTELVEQLYSELGKEMKNRGTDVILGPGMNIHRNPLCGRNFEYYSADPFLCGKIAAAFIKGIQSQGCFACPKHFAGNNQETNRTHTDDRISQRALREIYLKCFEIAVKEAKPGVIMTSYNKINSVWSHYNYELCRIVLRNEWGFEGSVITDWWMRRAHSPEFPNVLDQGYRIRSAVNVLMPGGERVTNHKPDGTAKRSMKGKNALTLAELQLNAKEVLNFCMQKLD